MDFSRITSPTLLVHASRARQNIRRMVKKAERLGLDLRPHFKTHQSAGIGTWFREAGVSRIAVSSVDMAVYFADAGWQDIAIAFPVNLRELPRLAVLARQVELSILVDSLEVARRLCAEMTAPVRVFVEVDIGDGRSGMPWTALPEITQAAQVLENGAQTTFAGLMAHAGHSYEARGAAAVLAIQAEAMRQLTTVHQHLLDQGIAVPAVSVGDSPTCSLAEDFAPATELRPGNFVFFDLVQEQIGSCSEADISVALACPVISCYPERGELLLHGGAVHLSKDYLPGPEGGKMFGKLAYPTADGWSSAAPGCYLYGLSQEHGMAKVSPDMLSRVRPGDLLMVLPVHSCLTADLMRYLHPFQDGEIGQALPMMKAVFPPTQNDFL